MLKQPTSGITKSAAIFIFAWLGGVIAEAVLLALWSGHGVGPKPGQCVIIYTVSALTTLLTLYQMFYRQEIPFNIINMLSGLSTSSRNDKTYYGWQAMLSGIPYLIGSLLIPFMTLTLTR
jgi:hypothetical protein